jgi:hypothetical protein
MALFQLSLPGRSSNQTAPVTPPTTHADERPAAAVRPVTRDAERWAAMLLAQLEWDPRRRS